MQQHGKDDPCVQLVWCPHHAAHAKVNIFVATRQGDGCMSCMCPVANNRVRIPKRTVGIVVYVCTGTETDDDGNAVSGCCVGSCEWALQPSGTGLANVHPQPLKADVLCRTTNRSYNQGTMQLCTNAFVLAHKARDDRNNSRNDHALREFVSNELHCFGLQAYSPYKGIPFMTVVDQTSLEPVATAQHVTGSGDESTFGMVGFEQHGRHNLTEWSSTLNKQLGLYTHPKVFAPAVPIVERVHLTEWTPLQQSIPAAFFFTQFDDAAHLTQNHLLAALDVALGRAQMTAEDFVHAVAQQHGTKRRQLLHPSFEQAIAVCAESATVLPNAFHYRTDAVRDPTTGKTVMMDKMERLNGWVKRSYGDCEDMAAYMVQFLHTLKSAACTHPVVQAARDIMQHYVPLAVLGSVTYVGSGGAKLADAEYKASDTMYQDGNAAHMWCMLVPQKQVRHMLHEPAQEPAASSAPWESMLCCHTLEGTARMSSEIYTDATRRHHATTPVIQSLHAQHAGDAARIKRDVQQALHNIDVHMHQCRAPPKTLATHEHHPFYKRPTHAWSPCLSKERPECAQFVFCQEVEEQEVQYSVSFADLLRKSPACRLVPLPVCAKSATQRCKQLVEAMPRCAPMSAADMKQIPPQTHSVNTDTSVARVRSSGHEHTVWVRGNFVPRTKELVHEVARLLSKRGGKQVRAHSSIECLGTDAPLMTRVQISVHDTV